MPQRFFVPDSAVDGVVTITGAAARHLSGSLRVRAGDRIVVVDAANREHGARIRTVANDSVVGDVLWSRAAAGDPRLRITVVQAMPAERMEDCIDTLVECGVAEIRPVVTERSTSRPPLGRIARRLERWRSVARESAQLAGRAMVPTILAPVPLEVALGELTPGTRLLACTFEATTPLAGTDVDPGVPLALCIGPEGGLGERDLAALDRARAELVHLGGRVVRTRYAGAVACALLLARAGDLDAPIAPEPQP